MRTLLALFFALALLSACQSDSRTNAPSEHSPSEAGAAFRHWAMARTFPDGRFYTEKYEQAMAQMRLEGQLRGGPVWEALGPKNVGGRTLCLAVHPQDTNILWAGSASGGIWRTATAGRGAEAWQRIETGFPVLGVSALAIDPSNPNVVYAGTGEVYNLENSAPNVAVRTTRGTYGIGILKTTDGGATWEKSLDWSYGDLRGVQDIKLNPLRPSTVYAATTEGLLRSYDAGKTWQTVHALSMAVDIELHPTDTNQIFVTHGSLDDDAVSGIYRSTNGGKNFNVLSGGLPEGYSGKTLLSICKNQPSVLYASVGNAFNQAGLFKSTNGGNSWTQTSSQDVCTYQGWYSHDVSVHPDKPTEIVWVGIDAWRSANSGTTTTRQSFWNKWYFGQVPAGGKEGPPDYAHADMHRVYRVAQDPNKLYYATDGGIFVSYDGGKTFAGRNGGYQTQQFYANLGNSTTNPLLCIGGMQDNSTAIYTGSPSWTRVLGGDGQCAAIQPGNDKVLFGSSQYLTMYRSDDGGQSFNYITSPEMSNQNPAFNGPFEIAPSDPKAMYAGAESLFFSSNGGNSWDDFTGSVLNDGDAILTIAVHPKNPYVAYFSTAPTVTNQARLFKFDYWGNGLTPLTGLPNRLCMDLAIHPQDTNTLYAALAGFNTAHVWRSTDGGTTWSPSDAGLPDVPTNSLLIDPDQPSQMYVGNDLGVWHSTDGGASWSLFSSTGPQAMLAMHLSAAQGRKLRVATYGLGVWQTDMAPISSAAAEPSLAPDFQSISPNPARDVLTAAFVLPKKENVTLEVLDLAGKAVQTLRLGYLTAGRHEQPVQVADLPAGTYGLLLRTGKGKVGRLWVKG